MENQIICAMNDFEEWYDVCSIKALLGIKVELSEMLAMFDCLDKLDLLRANEVELEM